MIMKEAKDDVITQDILREVIMSYELSKKLPLKRDVNHAIKLESKLKPPVMTPYRMSFSKLKKQPKKSLDMSYI